MNLALKYLETNPTTEFVQSEVNRLQNKLDKLEKLFAELNPNYALNSELPQYKSIRKSFESTNDMPHYSAQINFLKYLLNEK